MHRPGNVVAHARARELIDRAFLAFASGVLDCHWSLTLPCQGHAIQRPFALCEDPRWLAIAAAPATPALGHEGVMALAETTWPADTYRRYLITTAWLDQVPDRIHHTGLWGRVIVQLAGGGGRVTESHRIVYESDAARD
jgi:hypothetical protein